MASGDARLGWSFMASPSCVLRSSFAFMDISSMDPLMMVMV